MRSDSCIEERETLQKVRKTSFLGGSSQKDFLPGALGRLWVRECVGGCGGDSATEGAEHWETALLPLMALMSCQQPPAPRKVVSNTHLLSIA